MTTNERAVTRRCYRWAALSLVAALAAGACAAGTGGTGATGATGATGGTGATGEEFQRDAGTVFRERLERVVLPASFTVVGDTFDEAGDLPPDGQCFDSCPFASLYYSSTLPLAESVPVVERALRDAGMTVETRACDETCRRQVPAPQGEGAGVGTAEVERWIVDGRFDGYVMFARRHDGGSAVEIVLGSN